MRLRIYYRKGSSHAIEVERYIRDLRNIKRIEPDIRDVDDIESQITFKTHDVTKYPVVMVETDLGQVEKVWQGEQLPLMNDVSGYLFN